MNVSDYSDQSHDRKLNRPLGEKNQEKIRKMQGNLGGSRMLYGRYEEMASCSSESWDFIVGIVGSSLCGTCAEYGKKNHVVYG